MRDVTGLTYQPRLDAAGTGTITGWTVATSTDGRAFTGVAQGSWPDDRDLKSVTLAQPQQARYVRLTATSDGGYASAAEIGVAERPAS
jgi:alpha-galactosidase